MHHRTGLALGINPSKKQERRLRQGTLAEGWMRMGVLGEGLSLGTRQKPAFIAKSIQSGTVEGFKICSSKFP